MSILYIYICTGSVCLMFPGFDPSLITEHAMHVNELAMWMPH
jgi:hypothetical protein